MMTPRGRWMALPGLVGLLLGVLRGQAELSLLREFQQPRMETAQESADVDWILARINKKPASVQTSWWRSWFGSPAYAAMAAAAAVLVLAVGVEWRPGAAIPKVIEDGPVRAGSGVVDIVTPRAGDVDTAPAEAQWKSVAGAVRYEVALVEVDGTVVGHTKQGMQTAFRVS